MRVTDRTREALRCRRIRRKLAADGFQEVGENGGMFWELQRGLKWLGRVITAVAIAPEGKSVFVRFTKSDAIKPPRRPASAKSRHDRRNRTA